MMKKAIKIIATNQAQMPANCQFDAKIGQSLMQAATAAGIDAIAADCGGALTCATCHVYIDSAWAHRLAAPEADEMAMLEMVAAPRRETSRLSCQITIDAALDGLCIELPDRQY
jgi:ferredoxin, 2Fe-2S